MNFVHGMSVLCHVVRSPAEEARSSFPGGQASGDQVRSIWPAIFPAPSPSQSIQGSGVRSFPSSHPVHPRSPGSSPSGDRCLPPSLPLSPPFLSSMSGSSTALSCAALSCGNDPSTQGRALPPPFPCRAAEKTQTRQPARLMNKPPKPPPPPGRPSQPGRMTRPACLPASNSAQHHTTHTHRQRQQTVSHPSSRRLVPAADSKQTDRQPKHQTRACDQSQG